jgi:membrane protease YdiL (CAAX protease family)
LNATHLKELTLAIPNFEDAWLRLIFGILMPLFTAAIPEEFFFRGYLQTRLEKKWNRLSAIMLSTLLFTAWHLPSRYLLSNGVEGQAGDWIQVLLHTGIPVFIIGAIFALHWSRYRNIILLIITHWAIDILPSLSSYFKISF